MEICSHAIPAMKNFKTIDERRKSAKFHPSIWGDYFLQYDSDKTKISDVEQEELARQKEMVRKLLAQTPNDSTHKMELIDVIQRLGVEYHFEKEIEESLQYIHKHQNNKDDDDLKTVALRFRLLRQQGYNVPCDVFCKFIDNEGNFVASLKNNVEGLLNLFEAAHLGTHGEEILERAIEFCSSNLQTSLGNINVSLSKRVIEALQMPHRRNPTRLVARKFISAYEEDESHNEMLLNFAKLDFNIVQKMHQRELNGFTRWWKKFDVANKMPYARDRLVELFFWMVGVYFEPCYAIARHILLKTISMISIIDDTYEYATLHELQILTDAIQRWDINATLESSPPYIQKCYRNLVETYAEMEDEMAKLMGDSYRLHYSIREMKELVMAYFEEVKWMYNDYIPTTEEYMKTSLVSCGYMALSTTSLVGMGDRVTKEDFDSIINEPLIVRASAAICRLMDDLVGEEFEQKTSLIDCYMKQYGMSKDEARGQLQEQVKNAWKDMNQECLEPRPASMPILMRIVNLVRVMNLLYSDADRYSDSNRSKDWVRMVLVEPLTI